MHLADPLIIQQSATTTFWRYVVAATACLWIVLLTVQLIRSFHVKRVAYDRGWILFALVVECGIAFSQFYLSHRDLFWPRLAFAMLANIILGFAIYHRVMSRVRFEEIELKQRCDAEDGLSA